MPEMVRSIMEVNMHAQSQEAIELLTLKLEEEHKKQQQRYEPITFEIKALEPLPDIYVDMQLETIKGWELPVNHKKYKLKPGYKNFRNVKMLRFISRRNK